MEVVKPKPNPAKAILRKEVDEKLAVMTPEEISQQSKSIFQKIKNHPKYKSAKRIALFLSLPSEVDTSPILSDILSRGDVPFVPQYGGGKMRMLQVLEGDVERMPLTSWGIPQHAKTDVRDDAMETGGLDLVIAPGAAFTLEGWRLGHGGGYYDRYMTSLLNLHDQTSKPKPYLLGVGFRQQIYEQLVTDAHDVQLDEVVTAD